MEYGLYVITDEKPSKGLTHVEIARRAIAGGADVIQLRDKTSDCPYLLESAFEINALAKEAGVRFIVNDRLDIALQSGADGVHIGQGDMPLKFARGLAPKNFIVGVSAGTLQEALEAERDGADYIGVGPVFATTSKDDAGKACGLETLKAIRSRISIPVVAIGGIGAHNAADVIAAGADGIAVISAVVSQDDVTAATRKLKAIVTAARSRVRA